MHRGVNVFNFCFNTNLNPQAYFTVVWSCCTAVCCVFRAYACSYIGLDRDRVTACVVYANEVASLR